MVSGDARSLLHSLKGQHVTICDLKTLFASWPFQVNPNLEILRRDVDTWLEATMSGRPNLKSLKAADMGLFGATWWPHASLDRLRVVTRFASWLFFWDDEIDSDAGSLATDFEGSQAFRQETLSFVNYCLGLAPEKSDREPSSRIVRSFEVIGQAIRRAYDVEQCKRLAYEVGVYMEMSEREQRLHMVDALPSVEEFWEQRVGSSAINVLLAVNEFAWGGDVHVPSHAMNDAPMKSLWTHTNAIISIVNDLLSLKKEIAQGGVYSLVPLLYAGFGNAQAAVDHVVQLLIHNVGAFEEAARQLSTTEDGLSKDRSDQIYCLIEGYRTYCTGNLTWSLSTPRYGIPYNEGHLIQIDL